MKRLMKSTALTLGLLQAASLFAQRLESFQIHRTGGGPVGGEFYFQLGTQDPMLRVLSCDHGDKKQYTPIAITDTAHVELVTSVLHGQYDFASLIQIGNNLHGSWRHATVTPALQRLPTPEPTPSRAVPDPVKIGNILLIKGGKVTDAPDVLEGIVREVCETFSFIKPTHNDTSSTEPDA